jgi:5-methylcytosine-specific restriction endonuclease McrA
VPAVTRKRSKFRRNSEKVLNSKRWPALRLQAKRRDNFKCVQCGAVNGLQVDHIRPVHLCPEGAYSLSNLQTLCASCHARKTRTDVGFPPADPERTLWRQAVKAIETRQQNPNTEKATLCLTL